ncbi:MAG: S41 family peptidase, partial [Planctomycetota bacterium]
ETGKELYTHLRALEDQGMQGLVIDLRDNPGGLLASVKQCLTIFLKQRELVCTVKGRAYSSEKHYTGRPDKPREYPISILLNGRSASGAELMSGVMQHYSKTSDLADAKEPYLDAVVLGEASFGKGTVQHTMPLRAWPGETFTDRALRNGRFDFNEEYQDRNGNRRYDPGETYTDRPMLNRRWDDAEPWEDTNGNGTRDPDETFTDENNDGRWNPAEEFDDANGNGRYDYGAAIKLSVARYYLPGGRNFTRTRIFKDGGYIYEGGVLPDVEVKNPELEVSDLVVLRELQQKGLFTDYVKSRWSEHRDTFHKLAWFDARDIELYPDFEAFYETLKTRLSRQHVRSAIRVEVRREVANELGREILGDLSDDLVLRRGVRDVLRRAGVESESIPEYRTLKNGLEAK